MSDERDKESQGKGFTVSDRRKRYEPPEEGAPGPAPAPTPAPPAATAPATPPPAATAPEPEGEPAHLGGEPGLGGGAPGPADFVQLVGKLYQEGLAFMGLFDDPASGQSLANFPVAGWHIDILGVLQEKTKGNLDPEEQKLLADAIANLKLTFVRASGTIKR